jgi:hypothetical protein
MGPVSEDFHAAFGLGQDDQHISPNDLAGVNSVAIQALYRKSIEDGANLKELLEERDRKIESLESELERLKRQIAEIRQVVATVGVESTGVAE